VVAVVEVRCNLLLRRRLVMMRRLAPWLTHRYYVFAVLDAAVFADLPFDLNPIKK
jgi:hypothetical protein